MAATHNDLCELRERGAKRPERAGQWGGPAGRPTAAKRRRPPLERRGLPGRHRATAVEPTEACWRGEAGCRWGAPGGGGVLRVWGALGPPRPAKPKHGRGQGPRPCFVRAGRARRPPGNAGIFLRPREPFANLFSPRKPTNKTSPPLPVSGGPAYAVGKPKKDSSQFSPAFLKAGQGGGAERRQWRKKRGGSPVSKGVEGSRLGGDAQRPLRTACGGLAAPHTASPAAGRCKKRTTR